MKITFVACLLSLSLINSSCLSPIKSSKEQISEKFHEAGSISNRSMTEEEIALYQKCSVEADCIYVNNGCCDCANGGEDGVINKKYLDHFKKAFSCNKPCTERGAIPPCGSGKVSCDDFRCVYKRKSKNID